MQKKIIILTGILIFGRLLLPSPAISQNVELVGSFATNFSHGVQVIANYAYIADYDLGLRVVNVTDPSHPTQIGSLRLPLLRTLHYSNGLIAGCAVDIYTINAENPTYPFLLGSAMVDGWAQQAYIMGDYIYIGSGSHGLTVANITDPTNPVILGNYFTPGAGEEVQIIGDYAYLADYDRGLQIINVTDPANPETVGSFDTPGLAIGVFVSDQYAYLANMSAGLQIIDILDPAHPFVAGHYDTPDEAQDVFVQGNYVYIADRYSGLQILNAVDPAHPILIGSYDTPGLATSVWVQGKYIYLTDGASMMIFIFGTSGTDDELDSPTQFSLSQNYPNPFNAQTTISYSMPTASDVTIDIFDILGRRITSINQGHKSTGSHSVIWDASDAASGIYFYRINANGYKKTKQMALMK